MSVIQLTSGQRLPRGAAIHQLPARRRSAVLESNDAAVDLCEHLLKHDSRSYYAIRKAMIEDDPGGRAPGLRTLTQLGSGLGPCLRFETLRRIAAFYGWTIRVEKQG